MPKELSRSKNFKIWAKEFPGLAASGADLKVWARLFLAGRLTGSITFVLKRYSYTPLFVSEFNFSSLR